MSVIDELREISRGIHPEVLSRAGLRSALRALSRRSATPVDMDVRVEGRLPEPVEVGAYYVVSETLTNAAKHARASVVEVDAEASDGTLRVCVRDDGVGGADPGLGSGLVGLKDRIEALGGTFSVHSPAGGGTTVTCELPMLARCGHDTGDGDRGYGSGAAGRFSLPAGISMSSVVPWPAGLVTVSAPPTASMRSRSPTSPDPRAGSAPPTPSSRIASCTVASSPPSPTFTTEACACLAALVSASDTA